jgi:hypothetical protein
MLSVGNEFVVHYAFAAHLRLPERFADPTQTSNNPTALVDVSRMLLTEALKVPHNQQFLLLSDACVPLYPPQARHNPTPSASTPYLATTLALAALPC